MQKLSCLPQDAVVWGQGVLSAAAAALPAYGLVRPITFTVEPLRPLYAAQLAPHIQDSTGVFTDFPPHVPDTAVRAALLAARAGGAAAIVALGGGSVLDAAKAVSHLHQQETGRHLPIAAFATTLSGSEYSHYFGITETGGAQKFKRSYAVRETVPRLVVTDPLLVQGTPRALLLASAIKGIDHAVEGMRQVGRDHPHAILAASGAQRLLGVLERWPRTGETQQALDAGLVTLDDLLQLQLGAWQCYFYPASVVYGLSHRIGHILGGTFGLPHSATSCITLAPVIQACAARYGDRFEGFAPGRGAAAATQLADRIAGTVAHLGLPTRLRDFGLDAAHLPEIARLLLAHYPAEVADLGDGADAKLHALLEALW